MEEQEIDGIVDTAWDALNAGDLATAKKKQAQLDTLADELMDDEALLSVTKTLSGAILQEEGKFDQALESFEQALKHDPDSIEAAMFATNLCVMIGQLERAIEFVDQAIDASEEESEFIEATLLKIEIQILAGDLDGASQTIDEVPPVDLPEAADHNRLGTAFLELEEFASAKGQFEIALRRNPDDVEAKYGLGVSKLELGHKKAGIALFLEVREQDLANAAKASRLSQEQLQSCVQKAIAELPEKMRTLIAGVPTAIADYSSPSMVEAGEDPRQGVKLVGTPFPDDPSSGAAPKLDEIRFFSVIHEMKAEGDEAVVTLLMRSELEEEISHFFGLDEFDMQGAVVD